MIRPIHLIWTVLVMGIGTALFLVAYEVDDRENELRALRHEIRATSESIHVLRAEWSYLNDPSRLERLADEHLGLSPITPEQYTTIAQLPPRPAVDPRFDQPAETPEGGSEDGDTPLVPPSAAGDVPLAKNEQDTPAARTGAEVVASAPIPPSKPAVKSPAKPAAPVTQAPVTLARDDAYRPPVKAAANDAYRGDSRGDIARDDAYRGDAYRGNDAYRPPATGAVVPTAVTAEEAEGALSVGRFQPSRPLDAPDLDSLGGLR